MNTKTKTMLCRILFSVLIISAVAAPAFETIAADNVRSDRPRMLFAPGDVALLQAKCQGPASTLYQDMKSRADSMMGMTAVLDNQGRMYMPTYALMYVITEDVQYANKAKEWLMLLNTQTIDNSWLCLDYVPTAAFAYDWIYDTLSESEKSDIADGMIRQMNRLKQLWRHSDYNNHFYLEYVCELHIALTLVNDTHHQAEAEAMLTESTYWLKTHVIPALNEMAGETGGDAEGYSYSNWGVERPCARLLFAWETATGENLFPQSTFFQNTAKWNIYGMKPDGRLCRSEDCASTRVWGQSDKAAFAIVARYYQDSHSQWVNDQIPSAYPTAIWDNLVPWDTDLAAQDPSDLPLATRFEPLGHVYSRSSWDENATWSMFQCGDIYAGHQHCDNNSFVIYKGGSLAIDSGVNEYTSHSSNYYSRSIAHNTILVYQPGEVFPIAGNSNDGGQFFINAPTRVTDSPEVKAIREVGQITDFAHTNDYTYAVGDATASYHATKMDQFVRHFLHIQPNTFIVFDVVTSTNATYKKTWLLHSIDQPTVNGNKMVINYDQGQLDAWSLLPASPNITTIGGTGYEYWVDGHNYPPDSATDPEAGSWRIEVSPSSDSLTDLFLHVLHASLAGDAIPTNVQAVNESGSIIITFSLDGRDYEVTLNESGEPGGRLLVMEGQTVILDKSLLTEMHSLTVNSGTGDGLYEEDDIVPISANEISGQTFDVWTGDTATITDVNTPDTTITMPAQNVTITATYTGTADEFTLTVNNGSGDGDDYKQNDVIVISADAPTQGKVFYEWTGDTTGIDDVQAPDTTLTMPAADVEITATYVTVPTVLERRVAAPDDDAEENMSGDIEQTSSDLELIECSWNGEQVVGVRFRDVQIPVGVTVSKAYVQFQVDAVTTVATNLAIHGEASDDANAFTTATYNISSRATTTASTGWQPAAWNTVGEAGEDQRTPDLSGIVQEIIDRPSWTHGNAMVFVITGTGTREAESYDGLPAGAPLLHVEFGYPSIPGDYNGDGYVDQADFTTWADSYGDVGENLPADGNGDGKVDQADFTTWADNYGEGTPPEGAAAGDDVVDQADFTTWADNYGESTPTESSAASPAGDDKIGGDEIGKWRRYVLSLPDSTYSGNPFEVEVDGTFTHTGSGTEIILPGYYAGNDTWKVGFMPTKTGEWTYITSSSDSDLNGITGSIVCIESSLPGMLKADISNPKKWKFTDGGYVVPMAFRVEFFFENASISEFTDAADFLKNEVKGQMYETRLTDEKGWYNGRYDYIFEGNWQNHQFDLAIWDQMEERMEILAERGLGAHIMFYSDDSGTPGWSGQSVTEALVIRYVVARLAGYPTVWFNTGIDISEYRTQSDVNWFGSLVRSLDPYEHPISSRYGGGSGSYVMSDQSFDSRGDRTAQIDLMTNYFQISSVPVSMDDSWFEEDSSRPSRYHSRHDIRRAFWKTIMAGGVGGLVRGGDVAEHVGYFSVNNIQNELLSEQWLIFINPFIQTKLADTFGDMIPEPSLVSNAYCIADANRTKLLYFTIGENDTYDANDGGDITVKLSGLSGSYTAMWFDPRSGTETGIDSLIGGLDHVLTPPGTDDWVLLLTEEALPGDYNGDGYVDQADFTTWADSYGDVGENLPADGNGDGKVDQADFTTWADNYGEGTPPE